MKRSSWHNFSIIHTFQTFWLPFSLNLLTLPFPVASFLSPPPSVCVRETERIHPRTDTYTQNSPAGSERRMHSSRRPRLFLDNKQRGKEERWRAAPRWRRHWNKSARKNKIAQTSDFNEQEKRVYFTPCLCLWGEGVRGWVCTRDITYLCIMYVRLALCACVFVCLLCV